MSLKKKENLQQLLMINRSGRLSLPSSRGWYEPVLPQPALVALRDQDRAGAARAPAAAQEGGEGLAGKTGPML